jgi:transposase-like protein
MAVSLWKRQGLTLDQFKQQITDLYWAHNLSQAKIAKKLDCDTTCIENWFKKLEIETRTQSEVLRIAKSRTFYITDKEHQILDGLIISDIHLESSVFQSRASFGVKHLEFAEAIISHTSTLNWRKLKYNQSSLGWYCKTPYCTNLHDQRQRWYPNGIKIVPKDIKITPTMMLWWYLGDGYKTKYGAVLCTDSFIKNDNKRLANLISQEGIPCHWTPRNRIRIEGNFGFQQLISYIGESPVKCYEYKWGDIIRR